VSDSRVRVGVNLLWLVPGVVGGSEQYATRLLGALADAAPDDIELVVFALRPFAAAHAALASRFTVVTAPIDGRNKPLRVVFENTWLPREARRRHIQVMHHIGGRVPFASFTPSVVTIHDLQPIDHPENFSVVKRLFLGRGLPRAARHARVVTAPSDFVRRGIVARFGIDDGRTSVVSAPVPVRDAGLPGSSPRPRPAMAGTQPFFLYPAITYAHKNHRTLLDAFARLLVHHPEVRLLLTGGAGPCEHEVRAHIDRLGIGASVLRTGRLPHGDLEALLDHAVALVFPSRYEGFGLPVAEAMAAGCPVIAADATALPEVLGDAGRLVDPDDVEGWHKAMDEQLDADRQAAGERGRTRVEAFGAAVSVAAVLRAYRLAASGTRVG
jgi:glycosyltransferase involved in cell wall biosynthesis